jgi:hypothetical protein
LESVIFVRCVFLKAQEASAPHRLRGSNGFNLIPTKKDLAPRGGQNPIFAFSDVPKGPFDGRMLGVQTVELISPKLDERANPLNQC